MAVIDFPSSPTMGQEYTFGDFVYVWDGVKWTTKVIVGNVPGGGGSTTYVSETAPVGADPGSTWFCTANGLTYILYADVDSIQWVEANPNYPQVDMGTGGGGSSTYVSEFAPTDAADGSSWYCTSNGITYLLLNDGDSSQWVESNPNMSGGAGFVKKSGDTMTGSLTAPYISAKPVDKAGVSFTGYSDYLAIAPLQADGTILSNDELRFSEDRGWHISAAQGTHATSLTRKDYVDGATRGLHLQADMFDTYVVHHTVPGNGGYVPVELPEFACDVLFRGYTQQTSVGTGVVIRASNYSGAGWVVTPIFGTTDSGNHPTIAVDPNGVLCFHNLHENPYGYTWVYQVVSQTALIANPFQWEESIYHPGNPPTALEVGAASTDRVNELETRLTQLEALVASLTGGA